MHSLSKQLSLSDLFLTDDELNKLSIPRTYFPPYFDSLPEDPALFDTFSLRRSWIEKALCSLYRLVPLPTSLRVCLFTWVIGDGLGDFSAQIEAAKILSSLPLELSLISIHPHSLSLPIPLPSCPHFFIGYPNNPDGLWNTLPPLHRPYPVQEILRLSHIILQMPTYFPHTSDWLSSCPGSYESIGEGGWGSTPRFSPKSGFRSMGLRPWEKGLFFSTICPRPDRRSFPVKTYIAYLRNPSSCLTFLQTTLLIEKKNDAPICLHIFPSETILQQLPALTPFLQTCGICSVEIYYKNSFCLLSIQRKGKILTLRETPKLPREEYQSCLSSASSLVGCRGDGSLTETLLQHKIPFFDFPLHKMPLLEGLLFLSCRFLSPRHPTTLYLRHFLSAKQDPYQIASLLENPVLQEGFEALLPFLVSYYNMSDFLPGLVMRAATHHFYPLLALKEKCLVESFLLGEVGPFFVLTQTQNMLQWL